MISHNLRVRCKVVKIKTKFDGIIYLNTDLVQLVKVMDNQVSIYFSKQDVLILNDENVEDFDKIKENAICLMGQPYNNTYAF